MHRVIAAKKSGKRVVMSLLAPQEYIHGLSECHSTIDTVACLILIPPGLAIKLRAKNQYLHIPSFYNGLQTSTRQPE
jgi:hypothetical protein